jgi:hypothetical protein
MVKTKTARWKERREGRKKRGIKWCGGQTEQTEKAELS